MRNLNLLSIIIFISILILIDLYTFKGIKVEIATILFDIHPFLRWSPINEKSVAPYIEGSIGFSMANTQTTSEVKLNGMW